MSGTNGMLHYTVETKRKAVMMFLEEHRSYVVIAKKIEIPSVTS
jgi:transposase-like protein